MLISTSFVMEGYFNVVRAILVVDIVVSTKEVHEDVAMAMAIGVGIQVYGLSVVQAAVQAVSVPVVLQVEGMMGFREASGMLRYLSFPLMLINGQTSQARSRRAFVSSAVSEAARCLPTMLIRARRKARSRTGKVDVVSRTDRLPVPGGDFRVDDVRMVAIITIITGMAPGNDKEHIFSY